MKKLIHLLSVITFVLNSCSRDDVDSKESTYNSNLNPVVENPILLKKMVFDNGSREFTLNFTYNGSKISKITYSNGNYEVYTYTGNNITNNKRFNSSNTLLYNVNYVFDTNSRMISYINRSGSTFESTTYKYNANGTISYSEFYGDNVITHLRYSGLLTMQDGEVINRTQDYPGGSTTVYNYVYDSKNSPLKNIIGFSRITLGVDHLIFGNIHNIANYTKSNPGYATQNYNFLYTYNSNNFPEIAVFTDSSGTTENIKYFY